jgi:hypothetical protein
VSAEPVVACTLGAADLAAQQERWRALTIVAREETPDGLRVTFAPGSEPELRALVAVENECCAWADWQVSREDGSLVMHARASGIGVETLHGMFLGRPCGCAAC